MRTQKNQSRFIEMFRENDYQIVPLGELCKKITDGSHNPPKGIDHSQYLMISSQNVFSDALDLSDVRYLTKEDFENEDKRTSVSQGDILLTIVGTIGRVYLVSGNEGNIALQRSVAVLTPNDRITSRFLMCSFLYDDDFSKEGRGNAQKGVYLKQLSQYALRLPSIDNQKAFEEIYKQADKSKFTDFKSRFIEMFGNAEKTKPLSDCIGTTFPGEWGEDDFDGTGVNIIRTTNFTNSGKLDLTNVVTRKIDQAKIDKKHLVPGDIILERSGGTADNPVGRVVYFEATGTFLFNNFTQLLRCKDGVNSLFVFYSLFNYYHTHKSEIRSMGNKTTGIQNLKMDKYWVIPIADASHEQQEQFVCLYKQADKSKYLS